MTITQTDEHSHRPGSDMEAKECSGGRLNGGSTPKRKLEYSEGQVDSPGKKLRIQKFRSTLNFWEGGQTSTALQNFKHFKSNTHDMKPRGVDNPDSDTDSESKGPTGLKWKVL